MHANTKISVYDTDPALYAVLARSIPEQTAETAHWVNFTTTDGVEITFFATYYAEKDEPEPAEAVGRDGDAEILAMGFQQRQPGGAYE